VTADPELVVTDAGDRTVLRADWSDLKECWQQPLRW
jgi:hypothetical protein